MQTDHELDRTHTDHGGTSVALGRLRILALFSAVLLPTLLVVHGLVLQGSVQSALGPLAILTLVPLTIAVAAVKPAPPRRALSYALTPIAGGLLSISLVVGSVYFPGNAAWWVPASLVSALPLLALALVSSPRAQVSR